MSEQDGSIGSGTLSEGPDDDELIDVLDEADEDLGDEPFDLDDEALALDDQVVVEQLAPDAIDDGNGNGLEFDDVDAGVEMEQLGVEDDLEAVEDVPGAAGTAAPPATVAEERLARLEATTRALAEAEVGREQGRVRRKVTAATTGAGAIGFIPILLQLVDVLHLKPELAATASTVAAIFGAFAAGWVTPERQPVVAGTPAAQQLLDDVP
jgi:hypothetical protein